MQENLYFFPTMEVAFINICFRKHNVVYNRQETISNISFELEDDAYEVITGD